MNSVDAWWNRNFPPYSSRRLMFLLSFVPVIVGLGGWATGQLTPMRWLFVSLGTGVMITVTWFMALGQARMHGAQRPVAASRGGRLPGASPPPPPLPGDPEQAEAMSPLLARPKVRLSRGSDFAITLGIMSVGTAIFLLVMGLDLVVETLMVALGGALLITLALVFRYSLWPIVLISIAAGYPAASLLYLFFYWLGGGDNIYGYWAFSSLTIFLFLSPGWFGIRSARSKLERFNIPSWTIAATISVLMVFAGAFVALDNDSGAAPDQGATAAVPVQPAFEAASHDEASRLLLSAWMRRQRDDAAPFAHTRAIEELFKIEPDAGTEFRGCGIVGGVWSRCVIATGDELILLVPQRTPDGKFYISSIERRPLDYPITYAETP